ncbi:MAG: hypothetical protein JWM27_1394 [Gemmatimonadetes bacterium]|jgi:hypothetical protein|nr:hypothetical protein [Gemmatimonadota bacterium]
MTTNNSATRRLSAELHVDHEARPGWVTGAERIPGVGEEIYCVAGMGEVVKVLGKTGDGSRLLEVKLLDPGTKPFFAAGSNVLVAPKAPAKAKSA